MAENTSTQDVPDEVDPTQMLANALKRMDGLIGNYSSTVAEGNVSGEYESTGSKICRLCHELRSAIMTYESEKSANNTHIDPRSILPQETCTTILEWLCGNQLQNKISDLQKSLQEKESEMKQLKTEDVVKLRSLLEEKDRELVRLGDIVDQLETENERKAHLIAELNHTQKSKQSSGVVTSPSSERVKTPEDGRMSSRQTERKSFRQKLSLAFGKNKKDKASSQEDKPMDSVQNSQFGRAQEFMILSGSGLEEWVRNQGLNQYCPVIVRHARTGAQLASLTIHDLEEKLQITNGFHRKKLFLAIKDALSDKPSPEGHLNQAWVLDWLGDIGLPRYKPVFAANLIDGRMLNTLTYEELAVMEIVTPFHICSLKCAIEALRMSGFSSSFLRSTPVGEGSQQVIGWSAERVVHWLKSIDLIGFVPALTNQGVHGAYMMLEVRFTEVTLAKLLGITPQQNLIRRHLSAKFFELVGPVNAQRKLDAIAGKAHPPLDPMEKPKKRHQKMRIKGITEGTPLCHPQSGVPGDITQEEDPK